MEVVCFKCSNMIMNNQIFAVSSSPDDQCGTVVDNTLSLAYRLYTASMVTRPTLADLNTVVILAKHLSTILLTATGSWNIHTDII